MLRVQAFLHNIVSEKLNVGSVLNVTDKNKNEHPPQQKQKKKTMHVFERSHIQPISKSLFFIPDFSCTALHD